MTGCAASTEDATEAGVGAAGSRAGGEPDVFDADIGWRLHPQVALREESFGALAYHYGNRRLVFLKSPRLVQLVSELERHPSARAAVEALVAPPEQAGYIAALGRLARSDVVVPSGAVVTNAA